MPVLSGPDGERGIALVAALWFTVAVAGIASAFSTLAFGEAMRARNLVDAIRARAVLEAGLEQAVYALQAQRERPVQPELRVDWTFDGALVVIHVTAESGRVDLNQADAGLIAAVMQEAGAKRDVAQRVGDAVVDWRDGNDLRQPNGAEARDYRLAGRDDGPANAPFRHVAELRDVLGVTPELYARTRALFTVATGDTRPRAELAPEVTRRALRVVPRQRPTSDDGLPLPDDGRPDEDPAGEAGPGASRDAATGLRDPKGLYTVRLDIRLANGYVAHADALIWMRPEGPRPYRLLDWEPSPLRADASS